MSCDFCGRPRGCDSAAPRGGESKRAEIAVAAAVVFAVAAALIAAQRPSLQPALSFLALVVAVRGGMLAFRHRLSSRNR